MLLEGLEGHSTAVLYRRTTSHPWDSVLSESLHDFIRTSIPEEYDFPQGIGAFPSGIRLTAPIPWTGIVFLRKLAGIRLLAKSSQVLTVGALYSPLLTLSCRPLLSPRSPSPSPHSILGGDNPGVYSGPTTLRHSPEPGALSPNPQNFAQSQERTQTFRRSKSSETASRSKYAPCPFHYTSTHADFSPSLEAPFLIYAKSSVTESR